MMIHFVDGVSANSFLQVMGSLKEYRFQVWQRPTPGDPLPIPSVVVYKIDDNPGPDGAYRATQVAILEGQRLETEA